MADVVQEHEEPLLASLSKEGIFGEVEARFENLIEKNKKGLVQSGFESQQIIHYRYLGLRYTGTDTSIMVHRPDNDNQFEAYTSSFKQQHQTEFGFNFDEREILIDTVRVRSVGTSQTIHADKIKPKADSKVMFKTKVHFEGEISHVCLDTDVYDLDLLSPRTVVKGPAIILN